MVSHALIHYTVFFTSVVRSVWSYHLIIRDGLPRERTEGRNKHILGTFERESGRWKQIFIIKACLWEIDLRAADGNLKSVINQSYATCKSPPLQEDMPVHQKPFREYKSRSSLFFLSLPPSSFLLPFHLLHPSLLFNPVQNIVVSSFIYPLRTGPIIGRIILVHSFYVISKNLHAEPNLNCNHLFFFCLCHNVTLNKSILEVVVNPLSTFRPLAYLWWLFRTAALSWQSHSRNIPSFCTISIRQFIKLLLSSFFWKPLVK